MTDEMTVSQAAKQLGVSRARIHYLIKNNRLPARKVETQVGDCYLIAKESVENFERQPVGWQTGRARKPKPDPASEPNP